jgi:hypothetical protein
LRVDFCGDLVSSVSRHPAVELLDSLPAIFLSRYGLAWL